MGRLRPSFLPYRCTRKVALQGHGLFSELPTPIQNCHRKFLLLFSC